MVGAGTSGWDWVIEAFKLARQYFPNKKLVLNEYGVTNDASAMARYVAIVNLLKAQNLVAEVFELRRQFEWRGLGVLPRSALRCAGRGPL